MLQIGRIVGINFKASSLSEPYYVWKIPISNELVWDVLSLGLVPVACSKLHFQGNAIPSHGQYPAHGTGNVTPLLPLCCPTRFFIRLLFIKAFFGA